MIVIATSKSDRLQICSRDIILDPLSVSNFITFPCLVSKECQSILVMNGSNEPITVPKYPTLRKIMDLKLDERLDNVNESDI